MAQTPITAIVTAYQRVEQTILTLRKLKQCEPPPDEILVHVDGNQADTAGAIKVACSGIRVMLSEGNVGPGGGRNKLIAAAVHPIVASFDDDSYPLDSDYFARIETVMAQFPDASILDAAVYHQGGIVQPDVQSAEWVSDFSGGACVYRRSAFLATGGYVPLPVAYGMEEVDLALRLHAQGGRILKTCWLRVFHNTDLKHHANPEVTAASIANLALLTYLRYPPSLWFVGLGQCCNRIVWLLRHGRRRGIVSGLFMTPKHLWNYRHYRNRIDAEAFRSYRALRRAPREA